MAHEIDMTAGYAAAAFARTPAWHQLGKVMPDHMTADEALDAAGLDWNVSLRPVYRTNRNGDLQLIEDRRCVVRDDTDAELGLVSDKWVPSQNYEQVDFIDALIGEGAKIESAGSLRGGKRVWFLVDLKATFEPVKGDPVENYLLLLNGHDGMTCLQAIGTGVRVVCANTLALAMENAEKKFGRYVRLRHNGKLEENVQLAKQTLHMLRGQAEFTALQANYLAKKKMDREKLSHFFAEQVAAMQFPKERSELILAQMAEGLELETNSLPGMRGTAWQAFNVFSEWVDHSPRKMSNSVRMESVWSGEGSKQKVKAWEALMAV